MLRDQVALSWIKIMVALVRKQHYCNFYCNNWKFEYVFKEEGGLYFKKWNINIVLTSILQIRNMKIAGLNIA